MIQREAEVVICGAGICGVSVAYHLAVRHGVKNVVLIDEREPLTLTSDKSTECYRNWWPGPGDGMMRFMNRSIDLLEELADGSDNFFRLNRRGYVFLTAVPERKTQLQAEAEAISALGAGDLRVHNGRLSDQPYIPHANEGYHNQPEGADLIVDPTMIQDIFPFINDDAIAMLHARRCGWLSAQQLGMYLLQEARAHGVELLRGRVTDVTVEGGEITAVSANLADEGAITIGTSCFVNAAGPYIADVARMIGVELPVFNELHGKIAFRDELGVIPRDVPLMIWEDPVDLVWSEEERAELAQDPETAWLLQTFPAGVHFRPEGEGDSPILLVLWTYHLDPKPVIWPPSFDPEYAEIVMRGLARMVPGLATYLGKMGKPYVDGGYYCKTRENRPLVTPLPVEGAYLFGAVSGFGIMASQAGADLLAAHITGSPLPDYAPAFLLSRYDDPDYVVAIDKVAATSGQL
ncbi:MAG: FAD-binding oxidoreductase [Ardenticatenaceae bacterium]|nr:FAD-binding oxidoreductase [Ardenticatenaceae bacterium]